MQPGEKTATGAGTGAQITLLGVALLVAMAVAVPPAPIVAPAGDGSHGYLAGFGGFSDQLAEQVAADGYDYLALDLAGAPLEDDAPWRAHLERVTSRRFPVWGWIDARAGLERARRLVRSLPLAGVFVHGGPDVVQLARQLRAARPALRVLPVLRMQDPADGIADYALLMQLDDFLDTDVSAPVVVLVADQLDAGEVEKARAARAGDLLIARWPVGAD